MNFIYGYHSVITAIKNIPDRVTNVYLQKKNDNKILEIINFAKQANINVIYYSHEQLNKLFPSYNHQNILAKINEKFSYNEDYLSTLIKKSNLSDIFLLILDEIQDPHNLGACIRTANAVGVNAVIIPKDRSCKITPIVNKTASGAILFTPVITVTNLARTIQYLKNNNIWVYGTTEDAYHDIYTIDIKKPLAIIFGNEGSGLRRLTKENCDMLVKIPMYGQIQNLNVSVAVGVSLFEIMRKNIIEQNK